MTDETNGGAKVTYTVKELLGQLKDETSAGIKRIEHSLASKADKDDIESLSQRVAALEQAQVRADATAVTHEKRDARSRYAKRWMYDLAYACAIVGVGIFAAVR